MKGFIYQIAEALYKQHGDEISSLIVVFPSRRARLFFTEALSGMADRPLWQPVFSTVDEVMQELSGLSQGDNIRMITELYKVYSRYHDESFDTFYFWGEMLLADFDSIDKYMINADMLFANLSDLKDIEADMTYLSPEQVEIISRFWKSIGAEAEFSKEKQKFISIWRTLAAVYHDFRSNLLSQGQVYTGMLYREAAEKIKSGNIHNGAGRDAARHYVIAGFNALSESEKILFDYLAKQYKVDFFWDYDHYYLDNPEQEAGLFLRENIKRFPQAISLPYSYNGFSGHKEITVISAPSDSMQCKYVGSFIAGLENKPAKETAIVLTNENLLTPVLYSIPDEVDKINVTMGYPLRMTQAYTFTERLIELQARKRQKSSRLSFYHSDAVGLLRHPFIMERHPETAVGLTAQIVERQQIYIDKTAFTGAGELIEKIFTSADSWEELAGYLIGVISLVAEYRPQGDELRDEYKQRVEFLAVISESIMKLRNSLDGCGIVLSPKIFASLLRKVLQNATIPYEGEPLEGIQVMGILETRNLDFENVLILSANDDTFPGNRAASSSFIPYNLRLAYGLPTPLHHEGVYAYYFYRLLQRAKNIHIAYSSKSDEKSSGEQSRYIYQLEYESPHKIRRVNIGLDVSQGVAEPITVPKTGDVWVGLEKFLYDKNEQDRLPVRLSPTAFYNYVACPLKFYFYSVARISPEDEVSEEIDAPMFGNILHKAMQILYTPFVGVNAPQAGMRKLIGSDKVAESVRQAIRDEYFHGDDVPEDDYGGNLLLIKDIVTKYINTCILPYDASTGGVVIEKLEDKLSCAFSFAGDGTSSAVLFGGKADRMDRLADGKRRVVDYKTGAVRLEFKGVEALFGKSQALQNPAVTQTMLYSMMVHKTARSDVQPALYYVRSLNSEGYSPLPEDKESGRRMESYLDYSEVFENNVRQVLSEMFDRNQPFIQCEDTKHCEWCDFNVICRR